MSKPFINSIVENTLHFTATEAEMFQNSKLLPRYFSSAVDEVGGIENQGDQYGKIEPEKSIPSPEKGTTPTLRKKKF